MKKKSKINRIKEKLKSKKSFIIKLIFPIEFVLSLLVTCLMFQFVIVKNYEHYISLKLIFEIAILGLGTLLLIICSCKNSDGKIEKIVISFLIPIGMMYAIFMLPSLISDEDAHLKKAYDVSMGEFLGRKDSIAIVPKELVTGIRPHIESYKQFTDSLTKKTDYQDMVETATPAMSYPFILYLFSALGFAIARIFSINVLIGCYLAKLMNFIVFLIAAYYVLKIIPFGKLPMTAIMFMPMFLQQTTSTSADCLINVITMLFITFVLHIYFKEEMITKKEGNGVVILGILLSISKYVSENVQNHPSKCPLSLFCTILD